MPRRVLAPFAIAFLHALPWVLYRWRGAGVWIPYDFISRGESGYWRPMPSWFIFELMLQVQLAQSLLFAVWCALSSRPLGWRVAHTLAVIALLARLHGYGQYVEQWAFAKRWFFDWALGPALVTFTAMWSYRIISQLRDSEPIGSRARRQASLRHLLWSLAGFSVAIVVWRTMLTDQESWALARSFAIKWPMYLGIGMSGVLYVWLVCGRTMFLMRCFAGLAGVFVAAVWTYDGNRVYLSMEDTPRHFLQHLITAAVFITTLYTLAVVGNRSSREAV